MRSKIDINLLIILNILIEERSVSRAAARLAMSQPAVSHALKRLRHLFQDDLLIKSHRRMVLTPVAENLQGILQHHLQALEDTLKAAQRFEPLKETKTFHISCSDYASLLILPKLLQRLQKEAPNVNVIVHSIDNFSIHAALENHNIDLAIGVFYEKPSKLFSEILFQEKFVCLSDKNHCPEPWDLKHFLARPHINVAFRGEEPLAIENILMQKNLKRRIRITIPYTLAAFYLLKDTDLITSLPEHLVQLFSLDFLKILPMPFDMPIFSAYQIWHPRNHNSKAHRWFRELIYQTSHR